MDYLGSYLQWRRPKLFCILNNLHVPNMFIINILNLFKVKVLLHMEAIRQDEFGSIIEGFRSTCREVLPSLQSPTPKSVYRFPKDIFDHMIIPIPNKKARKHITSKVTLATTNSWPSFHHSDLRDLDEVYDIDI